MARADQPSDAPVYIRGFHTPVGQLESTPISELPYQIKKPGTYHLTRDLEGRRGLTAIIVQSDQVTLNLNGYTLRGEGGETAILADPATPHSGLRILNGYINGWAGDGINAARLKNGIFQNLVISDNAGNGLKAGKFSLVQSCIFSSNTFDGVTADRGSVITDSISQSNGDRGFELESGCTIRNSVARENGNDGIRQRTGGLAEGCIASWNSGDGIDVSSGITVRKCNLSFNRGDGILAQNDCLILDNTSQENGFGKGGANIRVAGRNNRVENNHCVSGDFGILADTPGNFIQQNTVRGAGKNYRFSEGNHLELILTELPAVIDWPAMVKIASDITVERAVTGLVINASGVTIDLQGHTLSGGQLGSSCITTEGGVIDGLNILNGTIQDWTAPALNLADTTRLKLQGLVIVSNAEAGVLGGSLGTFTDLEVHHNGGTGLAMQDDNFLSSVKISNNNGTGLILGNGNTIRDARIEKNNLGGLQCRDLNVGQYVVVKDNQDVGIKGEAQNTFADTTSSGNASHGMQFSSRNTLRDISSTLNKGHGMLIASGNRITNARLEENTLAGLAGEDANRIIDSSANGNGKAGMTIDDENIISRSTVSGNGHDAKPFGGDGIASFDPGDASNLNRIEYTTVSYNAANGINLASANGIFRCTAVSNGADGIYVTLQSQVRDCQSTGNKDDGIAIEGNSTVSGCTSSENMDAGIEGDFDNTIDNNLCRANTINLYFTGNRNRIQNNHLLDAEIGIKATGSDNLIAGNSASENAENYSLSGSSEHSILEGKDWHERQPDSNLAF